MTATCIHTTGAGGDRSRVARRERGRSALPAYAWLAVAAGIALGFPCGASAQTPVAKTNGMKVYMHYMPWFESPDTLGGGDWGLHWEMATRNPNIVDANGRRQIASHFYPLIGPYASSDPNVLEYHLLLMKYAGVDGLLIDWYGVQGTNGDIGLLLNNSNALVERTDDFGLDFAVVLEDRFSANVNQAAANVAYLRDNYFNRPNYVRTAGDDDPLLLTFGPITFEQPSQWTQILAQAGENVDLLTLWYESNDAGSNASGEYAWIYQDGQSYAQHLANFYQFRAPNQDVAGGLAFPGFDDYYQEGGWGAGIPFEIPHDDGGTLAATLALAQQYASQIDFLQLATWNDFGEGTMLEPTVEAGFRDLIQLQQFTGVEYGEAELQLVYDLYRARKQFANDPQSQALLDQAAADLAELQVDEAAAILESLNMPGDYNGDGSVDGADFLVLQRQTGATGLFPLNLQTADGDADGVVGPSDYGIWTGAFGEGGSSESALATPEPSGWALTLLFALLAKSWARLGHAA